MTTTHSGSWSYGRKSPIGGCQLRTVPRQRGHRLGNHTPLRLLHAGRHGKRSGGGNFRPGTGTLTVNGKVVDTKTMPKTLPMILQWDESFDIGSYTFTGVNDADSRPPYAQTAKLGKLTNKIDRPQLTPEAIK